MILLNTRYFAVHLASVWFFGYQALPNGFGGYQIIVCVIPGLNLEFKVKPL